MQSVVSDVLKKHLRLLKQPIPRAWTYMNRLNWFLFHQVHAQTLDSLRLVFFS